MKKERRLITAALPYVNNVPHLGNIVGSHLPADIFSRYCKLIGHEAIFIGGTDDHGTATEIAAQEAGITPKELCDHFFKIHKEIYDWFDFGYDNFSRTSRKIHHRLFQDVLRKIYKNGYIEEKTITLPFCLDCDRQLSDRYIKGVCPQCSYESARGDQCESCSALLEPEKLKSPSCAVCGSQRIEFRERKHLFFRLDKFSSKLEKWIRKNGHWRPQVRSIALSWIKEGLQPRCLTRDLHWGIKVPIKGYEHLVTYVWVEAPYGYVSSTAEKRKDWKKFWKDPRSKVYHFIGKDNIPFHTIFFPATHLAEGTYALPYNVVGLQYLNYERGKFSKSKGHGVFCENLPTAGLKADYWRFYLSFVIPETKDTEFLWDDFQKRINSELIGNFGNFINRGLTFTWNYFDGNVPACKVTQKKFVQDVEKQVKKILQLYELVELREALLAILKLSDNGNKFFEKNKPWETKDKETIYLALYLSKILGLLIQPYLPETSKKILGYLNCKEKDWSKLTQFSLKGRIKKPQVLFRKLEDKDIAELKTKTAKVTDYFKKKEQPTPKEAMPVVSFDDWKKLDLRVGEILEATDHPDADKLYILKVRIGKEERQLVAGLKKAYSKEELKGKKVIVFTNLQPVTLRGVESQGMVLAAVEGDTVVLLSPEKQIGTGAKVE